LLHFYLLKERVCFIDTWIEFPEWLCSIPSWFDVAGHDLLSGRACCTSVSGEVGRNDFVPGRIDGPAVGDTSYAAVVSTPTGRVVDGVSEPERVRNVLLDVAGATVVECVSRWARYSNV